MILVGVLVLAGCAAAPQKEQAQHGTAATEAVYLAPQDGMALAADDLAANPQVLVVHDMDAVKTAGAKEVWIDKACLDTADGDWLLSLSGVPVVAAGYGDGLYAFGERLSFPIEMPEGAVADPEKAGFCVWLKTTDAQGHTNCSMRGGEELTVRALSDMCKQMTAA